MKVAVSSIADVRRLQCWLQEQGSWIDHEFAAGHLEEDLGLNEVESRLTWLAFTHRLRLAREQERRLAPRNRRRDANGIFVEARRYTSSSPRFPPRRHGMMRAAEYLWDRMQVRTAPAEM